MPRPSATAVCQLLLNQLRSSNLNFIISETPYSAQILLQKRFVKEASGPAWAKNVENEFEITKNTGDDQSEASAYKEKADEITILKKNIKTNKDEINTLRKDLSQERKITKEKEKKYSDLVRSVTTLKIMSRS